MTAYRIFLWGSKITPYLPVWLGRALSDLIGLIFYLVVPAKRRTVMTNLSYVLADRSLAERRKVARGIFQNVLRNYYDLMRVHAIPQAQIDQLVKVYGIPEAKRLNIENGSKGVILYSAHIGSFSLAPQVASYNDIDFHLLLEPIKPPILFELVRKLRSVDPRTHMISIGGPELRQVFRAIKQIDHFVCMAVDRDVTGGGIPLQFFGTPAQLPVGTAEIALRTGALLIPIHVHREGKHYRIDFYNDRAFVAESTGDKAADAKRTAERMLSEVEKLIRLTPEQWVVLQPIWPE